MSTTSNTATKKRNRNRRHLLVFVHVSLQTTTSIRTSHAYYLSNPTRKTINQWIPSSRLHAKNPKERRTIHNRPPYRLGGQPYLEHRQRNVIDAAKHNSTQRPLQEHMNTSAASVLEEETTTNSTSVHTTTMNQTINDTPSLSTMTNTSKTTLQNNVFSTWAATTTSDMMTRKSKDKPKDKSKDKPIQTFEILDNKKRGDELVTVADLEEILRAGGYVRESDLVPPPSPDPTLVKTKSANNNVAMPQISVLSYRGLTIGTAVSSGFLAMIMSITISPNLWLIGIIVGALYGYEVSKDYKDTPPSINFVLSRIVIAMGRRVAKAYLNVYDFLRGIWFMYKTGQLSYEYYKQYSKLDDRFGIGEKMDAWNARFMEGKMKFDAWEKENEVSRRLLAMLRTAWLVEQESLKKGRGGTTRSRYRIVQYGYDGMAWFNRLWTAVWNAVTGGGSSQLRQVLRGIRIKMSESRLQEIGPRIGAALLALITVSMVGAMFAIAPKLLGLLAIVTGFIIWPTWVTEFVNRFSSLLDEWKQKGRGEEYQEDGIPRTTALLSSHFGMYDKKRYHYYRRKDGSKKWYRTGRPAFRSDKKQSDTKGWLLGGPSNDNKTKNGKGGG